MRNPAHTIAPALSVGLHFHWADTQIGNNSMSGSGNVVPFVNVLSPTKSPVNKKALSLHDRNAVSSEHTIATMKNAMNVSASKWRVANSKLREKIERNPAILAAANPK
tara:strand:- start:149 stop:472 length:324 start_codon:yes stop_codon:yes gene_type:complete